MSAFPKWPSAIQVIIIVLLVQPVSWASDSPVASSGNQYEIPLSDLKKVEKKKPRKTKNKHHKEQKRTGKKTQGAVKETPRAVSAEPQVSVQAMPSSETGALYTPEVLIDGGTATVDLTPASADDARITHEPYSYVVTGKRTVIKAIISGRLVFQSVRCQFHSSEESGSALVPMTKVEGNHYTYTATIPALAQGANSLRYQFVVINTQGKETRSQEFIMPVNQTTVVPGWQQEPSQEAIKLDLAASGKPLEGFSDVIDNTSQAVIRSPQPLKKTISPILQTTP